MGENILLKKSDELAKEVYKISRSFPKEEIFGITSQLRRAVLSVVLNIIEGFGRQSRAENRRFLEISYASLKETKYLLYFSCNEKYFSNLEYKKLINLADEIARILWSSIKTIKNKHQ